MRSSIRQFWQRLEKSIHPDDAEVLSSHDHTFNLDFPPPAFIGDIDNAPIVVLMANGGYDPHKITGTRCEFLEPDDYAGHWRMLKNDEFFIPKRLSIYYTDKSYFPFVRDGRAVIVNAVAYRSPRITQEPQNQRVADLLPSVRLHRRWLLEEVFPAAAKGDRYVVAHRRGLWKLPPTSQLPKNVYLTPNPVSPHLQPELISKLNSLFPNSGRKKQVA
jgi:hypothetical protein